MYQPIVFTVGMAAFVWQMQICFSGSGRKRLLPVTVLSVLAAGLACFAWVGNRMGMPSAPFGAAIFAILLMVPLGGAALAWAVFGLVRMMQDRKK